MPALHRLCALLIFLCGLPIAAYAQGNEEAALLRANNIAQLDQMLTGLQLRFERGEASEIDLRAAYRPFYHLDTGSAVNLRDWAEHSPRSYPAHAALGTYLKYRGLDERGSNYVSDTPPLKLALAEEYWKQARQELRQSLGLTAKPYWTYYTLLHLDLMDGDDDEALADMQHCDSILPSSFLARGRYASTLLPRWGGSYARFDAFIEKNRREGVAESRIGLLQAIEHEDMGFVAEERGDEAGAVAHYAESRRLSANTEEVLRQGFLGRSKEYCEDHPAAGFCR